MLAVVVVAEETRVAPPWAGIVEVSCGAAVAVGVDSALAIVVVIVPTEFSGAIVKTLDAFTKTLRLNVSIDRIFSRQGGIFMELKIMTAFARWHFCVWLSVHSALARATWVQMV